MKQIFYYILLFATIACNQANSNTGEKQESQQKVNHEGLSIATFAGGCFWCTEAVFERVQGVKDVVSGYAGGTTKNPTYKEVSYGKTDYAESVQIYYNPDEISFKELFKIFMGTHYPTQLNGQGPDHGEQYRSAAYYRNNTEKKIIEDYIQELTKSKKYNKPIVTQVAPFTTFYEAEDYHQNYFELNPNQSYIVAIAKPKVKKFKENFPEWVKEKYK